MVQHTPFLSPGFGVCDRSLIGNLFCVSGVVRFPYFFASQPPSAPCSRAQVFFLLSPFLFPLCFFFFPSIFIQVVSVVLCSQVWLLIFSLPFFFLRVCFFPSSSSLRCLHVLPLTLCIFFRGFGSVFRAAVSARNLCMGMLDTVFLASSRVRYRKEESVCWRLMHCLKCKVTEGFFGTIHDTCIVFRVGCLSHPIVSLSALWDGCTFHFAKLLGGLKMLLSSIP